MLIYPCGVKVRLNCRFGASAEFQNLSAGCENKQHSQGDHLHGLHLHDLQGTKQTALGSVTNEMCRCVEREKPVVAVCSPVWVLLTCAWRPFIDQPVDSFSIDGILQPPAPVFTCEEGDNDMGQVRELAPVQTVWRCSNKSCTSLSHSHLSPATLITLVIFAFQSKQACVHTVS